jgi:hypothetical protein
MNNLMNSIKPIKDHRLAFHANRGERARGPEIANRNHPDTIISNLRASSDDQSFRSSLSGSREN